MKKRIAIFVVLLIVILTSVQAQEFGRELDRDFNESKQSMDKSWSQTNALLDSEWQAMRKKANDEWERTKKELELKWDQAVTSSNKEWVDYDVNQDTRSRVNFESGEIEVATLVLTDGDGKTAPGQLKPEESKRIIAQAEGKIKQQIFEIIATKDDKNANVLADQIKDPQGQTVTTKSFDRYFEEIIAPQLEITNKVTGKDDKSRLMVTAKIEMVPRHLEIRAGKYREQVKKYAAKYGLDPALIFAVIHTESYFNPLARSWVPAYGLMQLVPRYGATEAYEYLYGAARLLPADYLYNSDNNIMLGVTYLHLLNSRYFKRINNYANRTSLVIAAYNGGPTRLNKKIVGKYNIDAMTNDDFVALLRSNVPSETQDYILKVQKRIPLYAAMR